MVSCGPAIDCCRTVDGTQAVHEQTSCYCEVHIVALAVSLLTV